MHAQNAENGISLFNVSVCTMTGVSRAHTPITIMVLNILEPVTLLIASEFLPANDAVTETAVSGRLVPIATIVRPMMMEGTLNFFAIDELPSTKKSAPFMSSINPATRNKNTNGSGDEFIKFSMLSSYSVKNQFRNI